MRPQTMAAAFESVRTAHVNSLDNGNGEWVTRWRMRFVKLIDLIPSGSGIDRGPRRFEDVQVTPDAIRFDISYHHMNDVGYYDGWAEHTVTIRPAFDGITVRVSGRDRNQVKDHIHDMMYDAFTRHVTWDEPAQRWTVESEGHKPRWTRSETGRDLLRDGRFAVSIARATANAGPGLSPTDIDTLSHRIAALLTEHGDGLPVEG